jgi:hypothetical protein
MTRLWLLLLGEVVLLGEVLLVRMRVLWLRLLRLLELTVPMGHEEAEHLLKLLHEHGHLFVLLVAGGLVLLLHGESLGSYFCEGCSLGAVCGHRAREALASLGIVSEVLAELSLEGFEIRLGDGADAADTGGVIARAGGGCGARWQRWEFLSRLGVEDEVDLWLAAVGG